MPSNHWQCFRYRLEIQVGVGDPVMDIGQVCLPLYLGLTLKLPSFMVAQT